MSKKETYKFNFNKLKGKIAENFDNKKAFAKQMGLSETSIYEKLNGHIEFKQSDIYKACQLLNIKDEEIKIYFFSIDSCEN